MRLALLLVLSIAAFAQDERKSLHSEPDNHLQLCHKNFLRMYRVELTEKSAGGSEHKVWSRWFLIDDKRPEDKSEIEETLTFYRLNHIKVQYHSVEGELPE